MHDVTMSAFEYFKDLFFGLFLLALFSTYLLSVITGIIGAKKGVRGGREPINACIFRTLRRLLSLVLHLERVVAYWSGCCTAPVKGRIAANIAKLPELVRKW